MGDLTERGNYETHSLADLDTVRGWLKDLAYKPGSAMRAYYFDPARAIRVAFEVKVFDSRHPDAVQVVHGRTFMVEKAPARLDARLDPLATVPDTRVALGPDLVGGRLIPVENVQFLPGWLPGAGREPFERWIRSVWLDLEIHEVDEWLRNTTTGELLNDPHALPARG